VRLLDISPVWTTVLLSTTPQTFNPFDLRRTIVVLPIGANHNVFKKLKRGFFYTDIEFISLVN
jgi:hypothetical protein